MPITGHIAIPEPLNFDIASVEDLGEELDAIDAVLHHRPADSHYGPYLEARHVVLCEMVRGFVFDDERSLERAVALYLRAKGESPERQVVCAAGIADIVSRGCVYEIELFLTRAALFEAIGQVLLYREAINPGYSALIVGFYTPEIKPLVPLLPPLGISLILWDHFTCPYQRTHHAWRKLAPAAREGIARLRPWQVPPVPAHA